MSRRTWIASLSILAAAASVGGLWWTTRPVQVYTDGAAIRRAAQADSPRQVLWEPPRHVETLTGISMEVYEPRTSWDGQTLYFVGGKAGGSADIFTATRTPGGWTEPRPLDGVNSEFDDLGPQPSPDGRSLYFYSDRPGGSGGYDLWMTHRGSEDPSRWLEPINLGPGVNSEWNDYGPTLAPDATTLLFSSNRPRPDDRRQPDPHAWSATVRESFFNRPYDLYKAAIGPAGVTGVILLDRLNSPASEGAPCFSPAGDFVYFASDRDGGRGGFDLYRSRWLRGEFLAPENLGEALNTPANELDPGMAAIGFELFFSSDRGIPDDLPALAPPQSQPAGVATAAPPSNERHYRLFRTTTREVFLEDVPREAIDWLGLMSALWPNLLWLLLGLLALLLLLLLFRDMRDRRLSLLARCLLASLLLHCLLLTAFGFWRISTAVADFVRGRSRVQIVMADTGVAAPLVAQIRGNLVEPPAVTPLESQTPRVEPAPPEITPPSVELAAAETPRALEVPVDRVEPREATVADSALPEVRPHQATPAPSPEVELPRDAAERVNVAEQTPPVASAAAPDAAPPVIDPAPAPAAASVALEPVARSDAPTVESRLPTPAESASESRSESRIPPAPMKVTPVSEFDLALPAESAQSRTTSQPVERDASSLASPAAPREMPRDTDVNVAASQPAFAMDPPAAARDSAEPRPQPVAIDASDARTPSRALPQITAAPSPAPQPSSDFALPSEAAPAPDAQRVAAAEPATPPVKPLAAGDVTPRSDLSADPNPRPMTPVELAPARVAPAPSAGPQLASDAKIEVRDAARVSEPRPVEPLPASTPAPTLALDLALPSETELPASSEHRTPPIGALHGVIRDAGTREPIAGATVRVDLAGGEPVLVKADDEGRYTLLLPQVPDNFALTAAADGFLPDSKNVAEADIRGKSLQVDFSLKPENETVVAVEDEPEVHHLGNDRFEGAINSQFQRESEGAALIGEFSLTAAQAPPNLIRARITVMVKGVQCPHRIYVNDTLLAGRIEKSPEDGSFGEISVPLPAELLREGTNTLEIRAVSCRGDLDDFEFVNVQIHLVRGGAEP